MIVQMEFVMKGEFETVVLDFKIILKCFFFSFSENASVPEKNKSYSACTNYQGCVNLFGCAYAMIF